MCTMLISSLAHSENQVLLNFSLYLASSYTWIQKGQTICNYCKFYFFISIFILLIYLFIVGTGKNIVSKSHALKLKKSNKNSQPEEH